MKSAVVDPVWSISPLDGRYFAKLSELGGVASEGALIRYRIWVEAAWMLHLNEIAAVRADFGTLPDRAKVWLEGLCRPAANVNVEAVKHIEQTTNHDVKAVEYYLQEQLRLLGAEERTVALVHFGCTSEDINNIAYAMMVRDLTTSHILPAVDNVIAALTKLSSDHAGLPMLSRTHGQTASPTTLGKELAVFAHRLQRQRQQLDDMQMTCKMSGAVGNYNAHLAVYPEIEWYGVAKAFIEDRLGFEQNPLTTQIENHDTFAEWSDVIRRLNVITIGMCRDFWSYISIGYFVQKSKEGEVGSSTMPHKVNPIDFENAEGNLGLANSLAQHFSEKLPISRWQRDLSDSTVLRAVGAMAGHTVLAYKSCLRGLHKIDVGQEKIAQDLDDAWEVLAEPVQTMMRRYGVSDAYERLKKATRGQKVDRKAIVATIDQCSELPGDAKERLKSLRPSTYVGLAEFLATETGCHRGK